MQTTVGELAKLVDGVVVGDTTLEITSAQPIHLAEAGSITLVDRAGADRM